MKIVHIDDVKAKRLHKPLFTGGVDLKSLVTDDEGSDLSIGHVYFPKGVRNKLHKHDHDQVLIVTHGRGLVATKEKTREVKTGDVIWTPAHEAHSHGATDDSDFAHITVTRSHTHLTQLEE